MENQLFDLSDSKGHNKAKFKGLWIKQQPILLDDCEIKKARCGPRMEIMLKVSTAITSSPKKFLNRFCLFGRTTYSYE